MKRFILFSILVSFVLVSYAQVEKDNNLTKYEKSISRKGCLKKFIDYQMPDIKGWVGKYPVIIRTLKGEVDMYFCVIEIPELISRTGYRAFIEYNDLVKINKALVNMSSEVESDIAKNTDFLENIYETEDEFVVGYIIKKNKKVKWFVNLVKGRKDMKETSFDDIEKNSSIIVSSQEDIINTFKNAQAKIEELMSSK